MQGMRAPFEKIDARTWRLRLTYAGEVLSCADVAAALVLEPEFRRLVRWQILAVPFSAVFWEMRPVDPEDQHAPCEFIVHDAPGLKQVKGDVRAFAEPLAGAWAPEVRTFANLSGDAELVVPAPERGSALAYPHLVAFLLGAADVQMHALWTAVGLAIQRWLDERGTRVWVSTAGLGVPWLHVRLDSRPKYTRWAAYKGVG